MENKKLEQLISNIREITATDDYAMDFFTGATCKEISAFEQENNILFPKLITQWLGFADGCSLFDTVISFYGVAHGRRISIKDDGYICIGTFNYGDTVCIRNDSETIYLCGETVIEYTNFIDLLKLVIDIGTGGNDE
ncbi:MAG: SMI1/KNR4 family protein [Lachnospiraceae bacterium]|nr:SMI1/KNR4 family protein [Lachnospiraceae bacterium]